MNRSAPRGRRATNRGTGPMGMNRGMDSANRGFGPRGQAHDTSGLGNASRAGPLMTEHIQLHDLDLELELLKRKREIIEQQQHMLVGDRFNRRPSQYDYEQPRQSYNDQPFKQPQYKAPLSNPTRNFGHYYDEAPGSNFDRHGTKRPATDEVWQSGMAPKRFGGSPRDQPKPVGPRPAPYPARESVGVLSRPTLRPAQNNMGHLIQPFSNQPIPLMNNLYPRRDFNPSRVSKPRPTAGPRKPNSRPVATPNKLNSYPVADRKNLVGQASNLAKKALLQDMVLRADKEPSRQMTGRLELALGFILKDIKELHGSNEPTLSFQSLRIIKQGIRERIRSVMLDKIVGSGAEIIQSYREKHPKETDVELLNLGLEAERKKPVRTLAIKLIQTDNPEKYLKHNFNRLLSSKLDEMFEKLYTLNKEGDNKSMQDIINDILAEEEAFLTAIGEKTDTNENKTDEPPKEVITIDDNENGDADTTDIVESTDLTLDENDESKDETKANETIAEETKTDENEDLKASEVVDKGNETEDGQEEESIVDLSQCDENNDSKTSNQSKDDSKNDPEGFKVRFYSRVVDALLKRRLPQILPKYRELIMTKILNVDETYKNTLAYIAAGARTRSDKMVNKTQKAARAAVEMTATPTEAAEDKPPARVLPYFVKVFGRPSLPKRKSMQAFLDQFHPNSIKKHRGIHNLLFVGFADKADYDNILAADQTVVGNCTIDVKISDKIRSRKEIIQSLDLEVVDNDTVVVETGDKSVEVDSTSSLKIDSELDNQISDLLSSIREEEEKTGDTIEEVTEVQDGDENKVTGQKAIEEENKGTVETKPAVNPEETKAVKKEEAKTAEKSAETVEEPNKGNAAVKTEEPAKQNGDKVMKNETVEAIQGKETATATPTKAAARMATSTPGSIRTRRASRLNQNN